MKPNERKPRPRSATGSPVSIVVVDDHAFMREIICRMLGRDHDRYKVVAQAEDVQTALSACERLQPDLLVLDINLPGRSGIEAVPDLQRVSPATRILLCTAGVTDERILDALRSGAAGFVEKTNSWDDFITAIENVAAGEHYFCARSSAALARYSQNGRTEGPAAATATLTPREKDVLESVASGSSSKEVAQELGVSVGTIDVHRANLMKKLKVRNAAGLIVFAFRAGLIKLIAIAHILPLLSD